MKPYWLIYNGLKILVFQQMPKYTHCVFDLDGTLLDSAHCAFLATQEAFVKCILEPQAKLKFKLLWEFR
jgi:hypothetical protein